MNGGIPPGLIHILAQDGYVNAAEPLVRSPRPGVCVGRNAGVAGGYRNDGMAFIARSLRSGARGRELTEVADRLREYRRASPGRRVVWSDEGISSGSRAHLGLPLERFGYPL